MKGWVSHRTLVWSQEWQVRGEETLMRGMMTPVTCIPQGGWNTPPSLPLTSPVLPSSNSTKATGLLAASPLLAEVGRSTLQVRPLRPASHRLWPSRLSLTRPRWPFQKRERAAACSVLTPPCFLVWAVRKASSWGWSISAMAIDWGITCICIMRSNVIFFIVWLQLLSMIFTKVC